MTKEETRGFDLEGTADSDGEERIDGTVDLIWDKKLVVPQVIVKLDGIPVRFVVDTGCPCSCISRRQMKVLGYDEDDLKKFDSSPAERLGVLYLPLEFDGYTLFSGVIVHRDFKHNLLGLNVLQGHCSVIDLDRSRLTVR